MRNYTCPPLDSHPQAQYVCMIQFKIQKGNGICLPLPINQSTPVSISSISPQSSSDLETDQGDIIDEKVKQIAQSVNQMLLKTSTGNPSSNLTQNDLPQDRIPK